jgi:uncharacterized protein YkwD
MRRLLMTSALIFVISMMFAQGKLDTDVMLSLVNAARTNNCKCGDDIKEAAPKLVWDELLEKAAQKHANDMARKKFFSHTGSDKSTVSTRVDKVKFNWSIVGENIAMGHMDEATVVKGWMESPGHCKNIMNPEFKYIGVALSSDGQYWVQVFADKASE